MTEELIIWDGRAKRKAVQIECRECNEKWIIRKDRLNKHSGLCRSCKFSGEKNPLYGKRPYNYINGNRAKESSKEYRKNQREIRKKEIILMMGNRCHHCGEENLPMCCYHIHHVDPNTKVFSVMSKLNDNKFFRENPELLTQEINKCELLCIHCHKIHHYGSKKAIEEKI